MYIGLARQPTGRMGNRLFHYNLLRQLAHKLDVTCTQPKLCDAVFFEDMERVYPWTSFFSSKEYYSGTMIQDMGVKDFLELLHKKTSQKIHVLLEPPLLGEFFFDYSFVRPNRFISFKPQYRVLPSWWKRHDTIIGAHFRGTDFEQWNTAAILDFSYYHRAIDFALASTQAKNVALAVYTDDLTLPAYQAVLKEFKHIPIYMGSLERPFIHDFYEMTLCDILISSPSTFCIWAGILHEECKVIHSRQWVDTQADAGDTFWKILRSGGGRYYSAWSLL